jgi:hypothetical protein
MRRAFLLGLLLFACSSYGPRALPRDRFDYATAVGRSLNHELLLNLVKLRYMEMPVFMDVQQILAGYTIEGGGSVGTTTGSVPDFWSVSAAGKYTDRPTITFRPRSGQEFAKDIMTPIEPRAVLQLIQAGFPAELMLPMCVDSINGLRNSSGTLVRAGAGDSRFRELAKAIQVVQREGGLGMRIEKGPDASEAIVLVFRHEDASDEARAAALQVAQLLRLDPGQNYTVRYSTGPGGGSEIAMQTRSILQVMFELATQIEVPPKHEEKGWVVPSVAEAAAGRIMHVRSGASAPDEAFVSVKYLDNWFWIPQSDLLSKRTFSFLNLLSAFVESGGPETPTLVTIPAG